METRDVYRTIFSTSVDAYVVVVKVIFIVIVLGVDAPLDDTHAVADRKLLVKCLNLLAIFVP